ncbi:Os05g0353100 [Oryza sativa Japonica Group]|uniref:Os05g0353100 protein n=2 Tax=Oryza sativa subsp. japonica TaxID=39947 RepID=Q5W768_ORYSJ|nr:hypothetical protein [Oryza sativa Japonica Group]KAB8099038.1 hypothetical protein EE612_028866 [Oryza sativa]BAS93548.1 Os05g0353100 [Oryza sativa Japonica Group]
MARGQRDASSGTVGVDGFLSGGGFGLMLWKHGLASDLVVDATMVNAEGEAPRQGRHWGGPLLGHPRWRRRELLHVIVQNQNAQFESLYLGSRHTPWPRRRHGRHLPGARRDGKRLHRDDVDLVHALLRVLRHREAIGDAPGQGHQQARQVLEGQVRLRTSKNMPSQVWETTWSWLLKDGAGLLILDPYGGEMVRVAPAVTSFSHRQALYNIQYYGFWSKSGAAAAENDMGWMRGLYSEMEPYVSKNPRGGAAAIAADTGSLAVCRSWRGGIWLHGQSCHFEITSFDPEIIK